jgi:hypothetical protein
VDPEKIGVTGISGGGATTVWVAAADDRVKVAVPVSGMSDLESYVTNKVVNGHCDCMFAYNPYQWEWTTILALFAPKPLLFANSDNDSIFPMDGNRRIVARLRQCYEMLGQPENVDEYVSKGGHAYRPDLRIAVFRFLNKHLKGDAGEVKDADFPTIDGKELRVFPEDKDLPKDAINARADEVFVPKAEVKLPAKPEDFQAWKAGLVKQLREKSFRPFPERIPAASDAMRNQGLFASGGRARGAGYTERFDVADDQTKPIERIRVGWVYVISLKEWQADDPGSVVVMTNWQASPPWLEKLRLTGPKTYLLPRGGWERKNPPNTVERSLALLGRTADQGRVWDVAATVREFAERNKERPYRVVGRGTDGIIAAYAALFEPSIKEVVIVDPPASHRDGPHFLNVERVLDLPTALGLLAPGVKLTLIGAKDPAFDKTAAIYKLAGAADKFERK